MWFIQLASSGILGSMVEVTAIGGLILRLRVLFIVAFIKCYMRQIEWT